MGNANNNRIEVKIKNIRKNLQFVFGMLVPCLDVTGLY